MASYIGILSIFRLFGSFYGIWDKNQKVEEKLSKMSLGNQVQNNFINEDSI